MTVKNETAVTLKALGKEILPKESAEFSEMMFNTLDIHSDIGSIIITTEYSKRNFENFGKLFAIESKVKDDNGMRKIIVMEIKNINE